MATNDFLVFDPTSTNIMNQTDYAASSARANGVGSGTASSALENKKTRQPSTIAAVIAQFIVDITGQNAVDDGTTATLLANFKAALVALSGGVFAVDTGSANAYIIAPNPAVTLVDGLAVRWQAINDNSGASTLTVGSTGTIAIHGASNAALQGGEIKVGGVYTCTYDGTVWALTSASKGALAISQAAQSNQAARYDQVAALAPVQSVAGRTGAVTLAVGDVSGAAPLASPALTGNPTAPTQGNSDSTTKLATTAWVNAAMATIASAAGFGLNPNTPGHVKFPTWLASLVIQWGTVTAPPGTPPQSMATLFDIAFPANIWALTLGGASVNPPGIGYSAKTLTGFTVWTNGGGGEAIDYIAIGN